MNKNAPIMREVLAHLAEMGEVLARLVEAEAQVEVARREANDITVARAAVEMCKSNTVQAREQINLFQSEERTLHKQALEDIKAVENMLQNW